MAQPTRDLSQPRYVGTVDQFAQLIGATAIPMGVLCMNDGTSVVPFLDTAYEADATTCAMLGYSQAAYAAAAARTSRDGFLFARGCPMLVPLAKAGDVPVATDVGKNISMQQADTVKATIAANGLVVKLLQIRPDGYLVWLPANAERSK